MFSRTPLIYHYAGVNFLWHMAWCQSVRVCGCVSWLVFQFHHLFTFNAGMKATRWAAHSADRRFHMNIQLIPCFSRNRIVWSISIRCSIFAIWTIKITFLKKQNSEHYSVILWCLGLVVLCCHQKCALWFVWYESHWLSSSFLYNKYRRHLWSQVKSTAAAVCMSVCLSGIEPGFYVAFLYFLQSETATFVTIIKRD